MVPACWRCVHALMCTAFACGSCHFCVTSLLPLQQINRGRGFTFSIFLLHSSAFCICDSHSHAAHADGGVPEDLQVQALAICMSSLLFAHLWVSCWWSQEMGWRACISTCAVVLAYILALADLPYITDHPSVKAALQGFQ